MKKTGNRQQRRAAVSDQRKKPDKTDRPDGIVRGEGRRPVGIVYRGVMYPMAGMDDDDVAEVEQHLSQTLNSPMATLKTQFDEAKGNERLEAMLVERAWAEMKNEALRTVTQDDVRRFLDTREGATFSVWLMLRKVDPDLTLEDARRIVRQTSTAELQRKRDDASREMVERAGVDDVKPDYGPDDDAEEAAAGGDGKEAAAAGGHAGGANPDAGDLTEPEA